MGGAVYYVAVAEPTDGAPPCACTKRPAWARIEDDSVMRWPVAEIAEWEELRHCPECGRSWLTLWPEEAEAPPILCRPQPDGTRRLRDVDHAATLRKYCLSRLEEHLGELKEQKVPCKKVDCERRRLQGTGYCLEHLIAQRFGRNFAMLDPQK
jgi:hypothetical protein